jgi:hypothetical protein
MSKQINFFAGPSDCILIHSYLLAQFPGLKRIRRERAPKGICTTSEVKDVGELNDPETMYLVPNWASGRVSYLPADPDFHPDAPCVDIRNSAVFEYTPSKFGEEAGWLAVGRLYWAYCGLLNREESQQINGVFRWTRAKSAAIPNTKPFRIFPEAMSMPWLKYWAGSAERNPLYNSTS